MSWSDPIADMLTRIRNAQMAELEVVEIPHSQIKSEIARVLKREGYIADLVVEGGKKKALRLYLRYTPDRQPALRGLKRESRPGLRKFVGAGTVPTVLGGLGVSILSTSRGVISGKDAKKEHVGGEYLCSVW